MENNELLVPETSGTPNSLVPEESPLYEQNLQGYVSEEPAPAVLSGITHGQLITKSVRTGELKATTLARTTLVRSKPLTAFEVRNDRIQSKMLKRSI